jgi:hypothetical protein
MYHPEKGIYHALTPMVATFIYNSNSAKSNNREILTRYENSYYLGTFSVVPVMSPKQLEN